MKAPLLICLLSSLLWALPNEEPTTTDEQNGIVRPPVHQPQGGRAPDPGGFAAGRVSSSGRRYGVPEYPSQTGGSPPGYDRPRVAPSYHLYDGTGQGHGNIVPGYSQKPFAPQFGR